MQLWCNRSQNGESTHNASCDDPWRAFRSFIRVIQESHNFHWATSHLTGGSTSHIAACNSSNCWWGCRYSGVVVFKGLLCIFNSLNWCIWSCKLNFLKHVLFSSILFITITLDSLWVSSVLCQVYLNCPGGSTYSVLAIYDCMSWVSLYLNKTVSFLCSLFLN